MNAFLRKHQEEIEKYCAENNLNFNALKISPCSFNKTCANFQHFEDDGSELGLLDETPMPMTLFVREENEKLVFVQTEYTKKYLSL